MKRLFAGVLLLPLLAGLARADSQPNILFIFTDDHAPHAIGAYDGWLKSVNPTPNIDSLASQGMVFVNSFCTNSICAPSRAVILTGKHSHINGIVPLAPKRPWTGKLVSVCVVWATPPA